MTPPLAPARSRGPALDDRTLFRALAGDGAALTQLYLRYHPRILHVARRTLERLRLPDAPSELAAEIWLRLLDHDRRPLRRFDPTRGSFSPFLEMVASQHARVVASRWARRRRHEGPGPRGDEHESRTPCLLTALHHRQLLHRMLAEARPHLRPLDLVLLEEVLFLQTPARELGPRLGLGHNALYKRSERLRNRLRAAARRLDAPRLQAA